MSGIYGRARKAPLLSSVRGMAGMRRGLDFAKAETALKRAAEKALHGTREERSGRFGTVTNRGVSRYTSNRESRDDAMTDKKHELYVERRSQGDSAVRRGGSERASGTAPTT